MTSYKTDPDEFKRFHATLTDDRPDYKPWYFMLNIGEKDPLEGQGWKANKHQLSCDAAIRALEMGHNVGIAGTDMDGLVIIDVDDENAFVNHTFIPTLTARSSSRKGRHHFYFTKDKKAKENIALEEIGEVRTYWQYVVAPGSWAKLTDSKDDDGNITKTAKEKFNYLPDDEKPFAGKYTLEVVRPLAEITYDDFPRIFKDEKIKRAANEKVKENKPKKEYVKRGDSKKSGIYDLKIDDVITSIPDQGRHPSLFHDSHTGKNTCISNKGLLHCFRHNVSHNAISALAVLAGLYDCVDAGSGHKTSGSGRSCIDYDDGETIYKIWDYAKKEGYIPKDDTIPTVAARWYAISKGMCHQDDIKNGWCLPRDVYMQILKEHGLYKDKIEINTNTLLDTLNNIVVSDDIIKSVEDAMKFCKDHLTDMNKAKRNTYVDKYIKPHFKFSSDQIRDIKTEINKLGKKASTKTKIPLTSDRIEEDKKINGKIDIPIPYCHETATGERGTFIHSVELDHNTGKKEDVYTVLCYNPTWLSGAFVDPETSQHYMELSFEYRDNIIERMVSQSDVLTTSGLKILTKYGLNVPESKTKQLADFFATFIKKSNTLKVQPIFSRYGWIENFFIYGNKIIFADKIDKAYLVNNIEPENIEPFESTGTIEGWIDITKGLLQYDNVRFVCYAAVTALILKPLNGASFVMEQVGDTSKGKTITAQVAMSIFGHPIMQKMSTSVTKVFVERQCALNNNLPQFLDETSLISLDVLKEITYMIANETSRGRGKKEGGIEKIQRWKTVLLTTGESPLINIESLGGQDVRTISLYGGIGVYDPENVEYFKERMEENYAVVGPLLVQKIIKEKENLQEYYIKIRNKLKTLGKSDPTGVMSRLVDTYSLITVAGFIFESVMEDLGEVPVDAGSLVETVFCDRLTQSDGSLEERAFAIVRDWIMENKKCFCENKEGDAGTKYDLFGNVSMEWPKKGIPYDYVDIIPQKLKEILDKKLGHQGISNRIIRDWIISDRIVTDSKGKSTILSTLKTGMKQSRIIRLKMPLDTDIGD